MQDYRRRVSIRWNNIIGIRYREELILLSYRLNTALKNDWSVSTKHNTITIEFPYYRVDVFFCPSRQNSRYMGNVCLISRLVVRNYIIIC